MGDTCIRCGEELEKVKGESFDGFSNVYRFTAEYAIHNACFAEAIKSLGTSKIEITETKKRGRPRKS